MEFVYFSILSEIRFGGHFLAPPAGSVSGLRPSQGQSRFRNTGITFLISNIGTVEVLEHHRYRNQ